jgi:hypothetical protein
MYRDPWPSDIFVDFNGIRLGTWTCPCDCGGRQGHLTPAWWGLTNTQYGFLKTWRIDRTGTYLDHAPLSDVTISDLNINGMPKTQNSAARKSWKDNPNGYEICFSTWDLVAGDFDPIKALAPFTKGYSNRNAPYDVHTELNEMYATAELPENRLNLDKRNEIAMQMEQYIIEHAVVVPTVNNVSKVMFADNVILPLENGWDIEMGWGMEFADLAQ